MGGAAAEKDNPRAHRKARRCSIDIGVGRTNIAGITDTGASGGNCLDKAIFNVIPHEKYRIITWQPSVCVGINKTPVRVIGKILLDFALKENGEQGKTETFREEFNIIESLIHPVVIGLPFLQKHKAILSFETDSLFIRDLEFPMGRAPPTPDPPPPHLAAFHSYTVTALCRSYIEVYLTGNQGLFDASKADALYVRPFHAECSRDVPQTAAHSLVDPKMKSMTVEILNAWPNPINIATDMPIALVDTVNPEVRNIPQPSEAAGAANASAAANASHRVGLYRKRDHADIPYMDLSF